MGKIKIKPHVNLYSAPVVLVSCGTMEQPNITTIAWTGVVCSNPPMISISIRPHRYSYTLIDESREFVVNIPTIELVDAVNYCGYVSGKTHNKFQECKLTPVAGSIVKVPLIQECPINFECTVQDIIPLGAHDLFLGKVESLQLDEEIYTKEGFNLNKALALFSYFNGEYWKYGEKI